MLLMSGHRWTRCAELSNGEDDVRSSYYLEDVAADFDVQGLELDWACMNWDADFSLMMGGSIGLFAELAGII